MSLVITDIEAERNVRALAEATGEDVQAAVNRLAREELARMRPKRSPEEKLRRLHQVLEEFDNLPVLDTRSEDEILGYGENGLPS